MHLGLTLIFAALAIAAPLPQPDANPVALPKPQVPGGWDGRPFDYPPYPPQEYGYEYEYNYPPRPPRSGSGLGGLLGEVVDGIGELVGGIGEALQGV